MATIYLCYFCDFVIDNLDGYKNHLKNHHNIIKNVDTFITMTLELQKLDVKEPEKANKLGYAGLPMADMSGSWMDDDIVIIDMEDEEDNDIAKPESCQITVDPTKKEKDIPFTDKVKPSFAGLPMDDMSGAWMDDDACASGMDEEEDNNETKSDNSKISEILTKKESDIPVTEKVKPSFAGLPMDDMSGAWMDADVCASGMEEEEDINETKSENSKISEIPIEKEKDIPVTELVKASFAGLPMDDMSGAWMDEDVCASGMDEEEDYIKTTVENSQISEIPTKKEKDNSVTEKVKPSFAGLPMDNMSGAWMNDGVCASGMDEEEDNIKTKSENSQISEIPTKKEKNVPVAEKVKPSLAGLPMDEMSGAWMDDDVCPSGMEEEKNENIDNKKEDSGSKDISKNERPIKEILENKEDSDKENKESENPALKNKTKLKDNEIVRKEAENIQVQTLKENDNENNVVEDKGQEKKKQKNKKSKKKDKQNPDDKNPLKETNKPHQKSKIEELVESIRPPSEKVFVEKSIDPKSNKLETKDILPSKPIKSNKTSKKMDIDSVLADWLQGADDDDDSIPDELPDIEDKVEKQKDKKLTTRLKDVDEVLDINKGSKITNIMDDSSNKNIKNAIDDWLSGGGHNNVEHKKETENNFKNTNNNTNTTTIIEKDEAQEKKSISPKENKMSKEKSKKEDEVPTGDCVVCGAIAKALCSGCKHVFYCTRDCQRKHWSTHKEECKSMAKLPYRVERNKTVGRYLVATQDLEEGELILNESPMIVGPRQLTKPVCLGCHKEIASEKEMIRCVRCNWPLCSVECQDSPNHIPECRATQAAGSRIKVEHFGQINMMYACITVLRALGLREGPRKIWEDYTKFDSHLTERIKTPVYSKVNKEKVVKFILQYLNIQRYSDLEILEACGKLDTNCFEIKQDGLNLRAMFRIACIMSHDCAPNTRHTFDKDNSINIYTTKKIKKGQAVTATYTTSLWSTSDRRSHLWMSKCFWCCCPRCADPTEYNSYLSAVRCSKCEHYLVPESPLDNESNWRCEKCGNVQKVGQIRTGNLTVSNELKEVNKSNLTSLTEFLTKWETKLGPSNHQVVEIKYTIVMLLGNRSPYTLESLSKEQLELKINLSSQLLDLAEKIEPGMSRWRGMLLLELQTAQVALAVGLEESGAIRASEAKERAETAMKNLRTAATILQVEPDMREVLQSRLGAVSKLLEKWEE